MLNVLAESEAHVFSDGAARYDSVKFMPNFLEKPSPSMHEEGATSQACPTRSPRMTL